MNFPSGFQLIPLCDNNIGMSGVQFSQQGHMGWIILKAKRHACLVEKFGRVQVAGLSFKIGKSIGRCFVACWAVVSLMFCFSSKRNKPVFVIIYLRTILCWDSQKEFANLASTAPSNSSLEGSYLFTRRLDPKGKEGNCSQSDVNETSLSGYFFPAACPSVECSIKTWGWGKGSLKAQLQTALPEPWAEGSDQWKEPSRPGGQR